MKNTTSGAFVVIFLMLGVAGTAISFLNNSDPETSNKKKVAQEVEQKADPFNAKRKLVEELGDVKFLDWSWPEDGLRAIKVERNNSVIFLHKCRINSFDLPTTGNLVSFTVNKVGEIVLSDRYKIQHIID